MPNAQATKAPTAIKKPLIQSPSGHCPNDEKWFGALNDGFRQQRVRTFVRQVPLAGEETNVSAALLRYVIAHRPAQHRVSSLERIEQRALREGAVDGKANLSVDAGQCAQMRGKHDSNHANVWTSTESTAGRSRTIALHVSPASEET